MIKAPFGIVWTLVGAATPFSTWSLTRPPPRGRTGHRAFRVVGALGNADARAGSKTTSGARPAARPCSSPQAQRCARRARPPACLGRQRASVSCSALVQLDQSGRLSQAWIAARCRAAAAGNEMPAPTTERGRLEPTVRGSPCRSEHSGRRSLGACFYRTARASQVLIGLRDQVCGQRIQGDRFRVGGNKESAAVGSLCE